MEAIENIKPRGFFYFVALFVIAALATVAGIYGGSQLGLAMGGRVLWFLLAVFGGFAGMVAVIWYSVETTGRFKAGHAFVSFLLAFTTIITANVLLATNAVRTFPGLETDSPYVASQTFDKRRAAQEALGWTVDVKTEGGLLILDIRDAAGKPVVARSVEALVGRATHVKDDVTPEFHFDGSGYVARQVFGYGKWEIRMKAVARDGTPFEQTLEFFVPK